MSILVSAFQVTKSFTARPLFQDLTFSIEMGDRIGLIGPNGMGKSTLLKLLSQQLETDSGELSFSSGRKIAFLEQSPSFDPSHTVLEALLDGFELEDWKAQSRAHELLSRLELSSVGETALVTQLSGGWRKRVALARELMKEPDLLLLDEPTNHLDIEGIMWLENFLSRAKFATLTVTHDRLFLQRISNQILELDRRHPGGLLKVKGDYAKYLEVREQLISSQERREIVLKNTLRRETEWLRQGAKARTTKQQARIDRAGELQKDVQDLTSRNKNLKAGFEFRSAGRNPKILVDAEVSKSYGDQVVFSKFEIKLSPQSRIGLIGKNGTGKSTLIKVLLGLEPPSDGRVSIAEQTQIAYFDQTRDDLDLELTVSETLCPKGTHVDYCGRMIHVRSYLDRFLFTAEQTDVQVRRLSGGEQSRLMIAKLMLQPANLLVLDEPTNDLDMATLNVLEECIREFKGAVILVTHDRYFLDQVADELIAFPHQDNPVKTLERFASFTQWEKWNKNTNRTKKISSSASSPGTSSTVAAPLGVSPLENKKKKLTYKEQREFDLMESKIQEVESELEQWTHQSSQPNVTSDSNTLAEVTSKMASIQTEIDRLYQRWEELEKKQKLP